MKTFGDTKLGRLIGYAILFSAMFWGLGGCLRLANQSAEPVIVIKDSFNK